MKRVVAVCVFAVSFVSSGTMANEHEHQGANAGSFGKPGDPARIARTIEVKMSDDMRFTPSSINVKTGETVRLLVTNTGKIKRERVLGTAGELREHAASMNKSPEMHHALSRCAKRRTWKDGGDDLAVFPGGDVQFRLPSAGALRSRDAQQYCRAVSASRRDSADGNAAGGNAAEVGVI